MQIGITGRKTNKGNRKKETQIGATGIMSDRGKKKKYR